MNKDIIDQAEAYLKQAGFDQWRIEHLLSLGYFHQPASKGHHLAYEGGLVKHSVNVTRRLVELTQAWGVLWPRAESPYLVGMLHDLVKCLCYRKIENDADGNPRWEYQQPALPGHGACSVMMAMDMHSYTPLFPAEIVAITYHMGTFGIGKEYTEKEFDAAMKIYAAQIIATHTADWYAARVDEESEVAG